MLYEERSLQRSASNECSGQGRGDETFAIAISNIWEKAETILVETTYGVWSNNFWEIQFLKGPGSKRFLWSQSR